MPREYPTATPFGDQSRREPRNPCFGPYWRQSMEPVEQDGRDAELRRELDAYYTRIMAGAHQ